MARRLPSQPPVLPGFSYVHILGSGGFADVFLYEQNMPRRQVAVKVMLSEVVNDQVRQMFQAEANLMAQLSAHPSILTVYQASVSSDGRPYLVMELCSSSLSERYRRERIPVPEVLRDETSGTISSEVWAFAATVYSLLAGRSPFEDPGGSNSSSDLMSRIARAKPQALGRADVPASLESLLRRGMSRRPEARPASVLEFVRELQTIEAQLGVPQTALEIAMDEWALGTVADLEDRTRLRPVPGAGVAPSARRRRRRPASGDYSGIGTVRDASRPRRFSQSRPRSSPRGVQAVTWLLIGSAFLVIALGATALFVLLRASSDDQLPVVTDIAAEQRDGTVEFTWPDPGLADGDVYVITVRGVRTATQSQPRFVVDSTPGETLCLAVAVNRDAKLGDQSAEKCVDVADD